MAQAGHRVRIQQPDPGEAGVLAAMIAPFVDLEVGHLESTLRRGPALVGSHLERREAEQLARLFVRLGARAEVVEARMITEGDIDLGQPHEGGDDFDEDSDLAERGSAPELIPPVRQTQPFDARVLREALNERAERAADSDSERPTKVPQGQRAERASDLPGRPPPRESRPPPEGARDATQPFTGLAIRQAIAEALLLPPSSAAPATRPMELEGLGREAETLPRAPMRGRPARRSDEPPPRALTPADLAPSGLEPPPLREEDDADFGSVDSASQAFEPVGGAPEPPPDSGAAEFPSGPGRALAEARPFDGPRVSGERPTAGWAPLPAVLPSAPLTSARSETGINGSLPNQPPRTDHPPRAERSDPEQRSLRAERVAAGDGERPNAAPKTPPQGQEAAQKAARSPRASDERPTRPAIEATRRSSAAPRPPSAVPIARISSVSPAARPADRTSLSEGPPAAVTERRRDESTRPRPVTAVPRGRPVEEAPPPRPSGGHPTLDRARATAIRERVVEARPPQPPHHPWQAALLGLLPGMGQLYNGQRGRAVLFAVASLAILPWLYGIYDAWQVAQAITQRRAPAPDPVGRRTALPGQIVLDFAVFVALAGAWSLLRRDEVPAPEPATVTQAPPTAAPPTVAPPTAAPPTAAPTDAGPRPVHELLAEGRTHCGEGRFVECEARMLEIIERRPDHIEAHRLLVDARTQRKAREGSPQSPGTL